MTTNGLPTAAQTCKDSSATSMYFPLDVALTGSVSHIPHGPKSLQSASCKGIHHYENMMGRGTPRGEAMANGFAQKHGQEHKSGDRLATARKYLQCDNVDGNVSAEEMFPLITRPRVRYDVE
ncbi:hypothetical protein KEM55_002800, partial [Ascosphaera atra]